MKRYMYFCTKCNSFYSDERDNPQDVPLCQDCNSLLKYTGFTKDEWGNKTEKEKSDIKLKLSDANSTSDPLLYEVKNIAHDVHGLYTIILLLVIFNAISVLFSVISYITMM